ncbi:sulfatase [Cupriavidus sp. WS]|uniref:sulfatase family protein n=1 Tax=Cupriavidus sp. WS TaxID=1312922 RepID=UPI000374E363|nr:sulfatase [Cupriavidus sp. WS]
MNPRNRMRAARAGLARALRHAARWAALPLLLCAGTPHAQPQPQPQARPNILWITVEDITTLIGAYGDRAASTPNIDQLAREGVLYTHAYQTAGVCAPARAAMITGTYPTSVGAHHMRTGSAELPGGGARPRPEGIPASYSVVLPPQVKAFPEHLRKAGYYTTNNQKEDYQFEAPVTVWDESGPAASYRNRPAGKPFFAVYNFFLTHEAMVALRKDALLAEPAAVAVPPVFPDTAAVRGDIARMYTNIALMDRQVGELVRMLKDDGVYDDTAIFFLADNGGSLPWMKREVLERGTRVPLIVRLPGGRRAGTRSDALVSGVDLAPTVLSLAGVPVPGYMQGQAFLGGPPAQAPRKYVFAARDRMDTEYDRVRMVRDARYRYLRNYMPDKPYYQNLRFRLMLPMMQDILRQRDAGTLSAAQAAWFGPKPAEELYDAEQDPWEQRNLAGDPRYQDKLAELRQALDAWTMQYGDLGGVPERDMLARMWHGASEPPATATPEVIAVADGVRIACGTDGASIGYWIERAAAPPPAAHIVQSWDYERLAGELFGGNFARLGDKRPAAPAWTVYGGEVIPLAPGEILHVNAMRIGYRAARVDYADGRAVVPPAR